MFENQRCFDSFRTDNYMIRPDLRYNNDKRAVRPNKKQSLKKKSSKLFATNIPCIQYLTHKMWAAYKMTEI